MNAKTMFSNVLSKLSKAERKREAREQLIFNLTEDILLLLEEKNVTKADLAKQLGKSRSYVSQMLSGSRNMTIGTLSDICFSMGVIPQVSLPVEMAEIDTRSPITKEWDKDWISDTTPTHRPATFKPKKAANNIIQICNKNSWHRDANAA